MAERPAQTAWGTPTMDLTNHQFLPCSDSFSSSRASQERGALEDAGGLESSSAHCSEGGQRRRRYKVVPPSSSTSTTRPWKLWKWKRGAVADALVRLGAVDVEEVEREPAAVVFEGDPYGASIEFLLDLPVLQEASGVGSE